MSIILKDYTPAQMSVMSIFDANLIGNTVAELMSEIEGVDFTYQKTPLVTDDTIGTIGFVTLRSSNVKKEYRKGEAYRTVDGGTMPVVLGPITTTCTSTPSLKLYDWVDGTVVPTFDSDYSYVGYFLDSLMKVKIDTNEDNISSATVEVIKEDFVKMYGAQPFHKAREYVVK